MEYSDVATQLSYFQTHSAAWALYQSKYKRPLFDVAVAVARHGHTDLFRWWTSCDGVPSVQATFFTFYQPLEAYVHGHVALAQEMFLFSYKLNKLDFQPTSCGGDPPSWLIGHIEWVCTGPVDESDRGTRNDFEDAKIFFARDAQYVNIDFGRQDPNSPEVVCQLRGDDMEEVTTVNLFGVYDEDDDETYDWTNVFIGFLIRRDAEKLIKQLNLPQFLAHYPQIPLATVLGFTEVIQTAFALGRAHLLPFLIREDDLSFLIDNIISKEEEGDGFVIAVQDAAAYLQFDTTGRSRKWLESYLGGPIRGDFDTIAQISDVLDHESRNFWLLSQVCGSVPVRDLAPPPDVVTDDLLFGGIIRAEDLRYGSRKTLHQYIERFLVDFEREPYSLTLDPLLVLLRCQAISRDQAERLARAITTEDLVAYYEHYTDPKLTNKMPPSAFARIALVRDDAPETTLVDVVDIAFTEAIEKEPSVFKPLFDRMVKAKKWSLVQVAYYCHRRAEAPHMVPLLLDFCLPLVKDL